VITQRFELGARWHINRAGVSTVIAWPPGLVPIIAFSSTGGRGVITRAQQRAERHAVRPGEEELKRGDPKNVTVASKSAGGSVLVL